MGKLQQSSLNTLKQGTSSSKREDSRGDPKTEKKDPKKIALPAQKPPASPPPAYTSRAFGAMPAAPSNPVARRAKPMYDPWAAAEEAESSSSRRDKDRGRRSKDDDVARYGDSPDRNSSPSEHSRDRRKGREVARRKKPRRDQSESEPGSESESESEHERKSKSKKAKGKEEKALVRHKDKKRKSEKKPESGSEDDSDAEIVETRKRYEAISIHEIHIYYAEALKDTFGVNDSKIGKWCDQELIRMDTKTGGYNIDKLLKSGKVEPDDVKKWAIAEKEHKRWLDDHPSGMMSEIPRFEKYTKGANARHTPNVQYVEASPPQSQGGYPGYFKYCSKCHFDGSRGHYCGDRFHGGRMTLEIALAMRRAGLNSGL